jgi:hypothetical protein
MKNLGEFIGHFTVKNDNEKSLFKVYFYEKGISFDDDFLRGIIESEDTYKEFIIINDKWKCKNDNRDEVMKCIMEMLERYQDYLSNFFINDETKKEEKYLKDSNSLFLEYLEEKDMLVEIGRKDFEANIIDEKVGEFYVDNLKETKDDSKFYTYTSETSGLEFYLMVVSNKIKIGFSSGKKATNV